MKLFKGFVSRAAAIGLFLGICTLQGGKDAAQAARLAATRAARAEAAAKLEKGKSPDELQKEKENLLQLKHDIKNLLKDSKEYKRQQSKSGPYVGCSNSCCHCRPLHVTLYRWYSFVCVMCSLLGETPASA